MTAVDRNADDLVSARLRRARTRRAGGAGAAGPGDLPQRPEGEHPLSSAQRRLWFLAQLEPHSAAYVIPSVLRLTGPLDPSRLAAAWSRVVQRHEVLRTRYETVADDPRAVVDPEPAAQWDELTGPLSSDDLARLVEQPFDLAADQPWRAWLVSESADRHLLVVTVHHIASDGWSVRVMLDDLAAAYRGEPLGTGAGGALQYADFAHYRSTPQGREGATLEHWVGHLQGAPPRLELATDRPRPSTADPSGATVTQPLPDASVVALHRISREHGVTPFMVLLAGLHVVLGRWGRTDDVVIGTPVAGRSRREWEQLVGCFVNTIALRTTSRPDDSVADLLDQVREVTVEGLAHQAVGFEEVVDAVAPQRDVSSTPVYQVMLTAHTEPEPRFDLPGISGEWVAEPVSVAKCDLALHVYGEGLSTAPADASGPVPELAVGVTYRTTIFDRATVARLLGHLGQVLVEMATDGGRPLDDLSILTAEEIAELPAQTGAGVPLPTVPGLEAASVSAVVREVARRHPDRPAVSSAGRELTYAELIAAADSLAERLAGHGVARGDRVALLLDRSCDVVVSMLAVMSLGAAYVPIEPMYPDARVEGLLHGAGVRVVVSEPGQSHRVPADLATEPVAGPAAEARVTDHGTPDDVAYVLFTSGTTGTPKGVQVEHRNVLAYLRGLHAMVAPEPGWAWAMVTTPCADLGLTNLFGALTSGGLVHLMTYQQVTDPAAMRAYFAAHRIDAMKLVPSHLQAIWQDDEPTSVLPRRLLILAGEACPWQLVEQVRALGVPELAVHNHYGPTETTVSSMGLPIPAQHRVGAGPVVPLGRPFPGTRAHVLDLHDHPTPVGVPGELVLAGPTVARGYLGAAAERAADRFTAEPQPSTGAAERAYRTGDLVRRLPTGEIEFLGRADDQIKIRGYRVEPGDVAHAVRQFAGVAECVVVARQDRPGTTTLAAYLTADGDPEGLPLAELREHLRATLPDYMVPADLVPMAALPVTVNGKLDRSALPVPDPTLRGAGAGGGELSGATEERVAAVWCDVLGIEGVGPNDNFFDVGGDSFSAVRVVRALDAGVSVVDLFVCPTVRGLAALVDGPQDADGSLLRRLGDRSREADVHVVCVPYGGGSPVTFAPLADSVGAGIAVHGVDLPAHDTTRRDEEPRPLREVAAELVPQIQALGGEVVLYGHCLGGALATETALQLEQAGVPVLGVVAGGTFPAARLPGRLARTMAKVLPTDRWLSDRAYHEMLRSLGGFTDVVDPEDRAFLVRALRHDAREAEGYYTARYAEVEAGREVPRLEAPMLCVVGDRDRATELYQERFAEWGDFSDDVDLAVIPSAGHYFLKHQADDLGSRLTDQVRRWRSGQRPRTDSAVAGAGEASTRTFLLVAITQLLSMLGTGLTSFGLGVWVMQETGSVSRFALISVLAVLPAILLSPIAGAVADRFDRRRVMVVADAVAGLATAALAVLIVTGRLELWFIYLFALVGSASNAFQRPAYLAAVTQLVPKRYLGQANGLVTLGTSAGDMLAALLGGVVFGLFGLGAVVAVDATTFLVAFGVLLAVRFPKRLWMKREETFRAEVAGGWRYIVRRRPLVVMVVFFVVFNLLLAVPLVMVTPLVLADHSSQVLGAVLSAGGIGALIGSLVMAVWGGTRRRAIGMVGGTITLGLSVVLLGLTSIPVVQGVAMAGLTGSLIVLNAHWLALIQTKVGLELQGRVLAINQMLAMSSMPIGFLAVGPLSEQAEGLTARGGLFEEIAVALGLGQGAHLGLTVVLVGLVTAVWGVLGMLTPALRRMEDDLPDSIPDPVIASDRDELQRQADEALARHRESLATTSAS